MVSEQYFQIVGENVAAFIQARNRFREKADSANLTQRFFLEQKTVLAIQKIRDALIVIPGVRHQATQKLNEAIAMLDNSKIPAGTATRVASQNIKEIIKDAIEKLADPQDPSKEQVKSFKKYLPRDWESLLDK